MGGGGEGPGGGGVSGSAGVSEFSSPMNQKKIIKKILGGEAGGGGLELVFF